MSPDRTKEFSDGLKIDIANSGGISDESFRFEPGVTVLSGRNATNRTSLLKALTTAFGGSGATVRETADEGHLSLEANDGEEYSVTLKTTGRGTAASGSRPVSDPDKQAAITLFASLTGDNEIRRAVRDGGDGERLRDLLMEPVDSDQIASDIRDLKQRREAATDRLNEIRNIKDRITGYRERMTETERELQEVSERLENAKEDSTGQADVEAIRAEQERLDEALSSLEDKQSRLDSLRSEKDIAEKAINETEVDIESAKAEIARLQTGGPEYPEDLDARIKELQTQRDDLDSEVSEIEGIIKFNTTHLDSDLARGIDAGNGKDGRRSITDELVTESLSCWTCGQDATKQQIQETLDGLRDIASDRRADLAAIEEELSSLRESKQDIRAHRDSIASAQERVDNLESKLQSRQKRLERVTEDIEELKGEIEETEETIDGLDIRETEKEAIEAQQQINKLERKKGRLENRLESIEEDIEDAKEETEQEDEVEERVDSLTDEIKDKRAIVSDREQAVVDSFNEAADDIYESLGYEGIGRIWLERLHGEDSTGAHPDTVFKLHAVREVDGTTTESPIGTLSESEREVVGLTLALAGYIAHSVNQYMPALLLDSVESIDAQRVDALLEYISDHADYVIATTLPEDEPVLSDAYDRTHFEAAEEP